jgi:rhodanese-related sulfurtransferase
LDPEAFEKLANQSGAIILDVRHQDVFAKGHIPQSIFIGIDGGFAPWVGAMIGDVSQPILLVTPEGREEETVMRLARVGFDNTLGYLKGSFEAWKKEGKTTDKVEGIDAAGLKALSEKESVTVFDVRKPGEYLSEHIPDAKSTPLDFINEHMNEFPTEKPFYMHCAGGYRSMIAASILKSRGIHNLIDIKGGFGAIKESGMKVSDYICPSTL